MTLALRQESVNFHSRVADSTHIQSVSEKYTICAMTSYGNHFFDVESRSDLTQVSQLELLALTNVDADDVINIMCEISHKVTVESAYKVGIMTTDDTFYFNIHSEVDVSSLEPSAVLGFIEPEALDKVPGDIINVMVWPASDVSFN
ncbi:hypothetical protein [Alteromonas antoniana]|uniref:hypothetical protein n=1 Tax=Alteromonas antoniana TaxID=2803813 RepID=UPI001C44F9DD|nr:hypothetical protein [Alteromonas antoniana]